MLRLQTQAASSLEHAFGVVPLITQMPLGEFGVGSHGSHGSGGGGGGGAGGMALVDLVRLETVDWSDADGVAVQRKPITPESCGEVCATTMCVDAACICLHSVACSCMG